MSKWLDINRDSWTFTKKRIIGFGQGIGEYKISYAISLERGHILNGKISADLKISNRHLTGAGLICRANDTWTFLAFHTAPSTNDGEYTFARISLVKQGVFIPIGALDEEIHLDDDYNKFSLEWFSGNIRGEIKTSKKKYEIVCTCPQVPFPGNVGLLKLYDAGVTVKNITIEETNIPFGEIQKKGRKMEKYKYHVFICHSSVDKPIILNELLELFKKEGISYWLDAEQIDFGDPISQRIEDGLKNSKYVMPCLSDNLYQSGWTRAEYSSILNSEFSGNTERIVVPLMLDNCTVKDIPLLLRDKKRVTFSNKTEFLEFLRFLRN